MQRVVNREETVVEIEIDDVLAVSLSCGFFRFALKVARKGRINPAVRYFLETVPRHMDISWNKM